MLQSLIVSGSQENENFKLFTSEPVVHDFVSVSLVAKCVQISSNLVHGLETEGSSISELTIKRTSLRQDAFNQMANCHTRWDSVRVNDQVRDHTFSCKR